MSSNDFIVDSLCVGVPTACRVNENRFAILKHLLFFDEVFCNLANEMQNVGSVLGLEFRSAGTFAIISGLLSPQNRQLALVVLRGHSLHLVSQPPSKSSSAVCRSDARMNG